MKVRGHLLISLVIVCTLACSGKGRGDHLHSGDEPSGAGRGGAVAPEPAGGLRDGGAAANRGATGDVLHVRVEDRAELAIEIVTLRCKGDCAEVEAVAHGGNPPYAFAWSDGSKDAAREICADATQEFTVSATDTAMTDDEFGYQAQTATAKVTANVFDCSSADAGAPDGSVAEPPDSECTDTVDENVDGAKAWSVCGPSPELEDVDGMPALTCDEYTGITDIQEFARVAGYDGAPAEQESLGGALCLPLQANERRTLRLWLGGAYNSDWKFPDGKTDVNVQVELWGGDSQCDKGELLWTSEVLSIGQWLDDQCAEIMPTQSHTHVRASFHLSGRISTHQFGCSGFAFQPLGDQCAP